MAAPRPKKKIIKKTDVKKPKAGTSRPAKDIKAGDMRSQVLEKGKPQKAKDLRSNDPKSLRNKALREANYNRPRPAKDIKKGGARAQYLKDLKKPGTSLTVTNRPLARVGEKAVEKIGTSISKPKGGGMSFIKKVGVGQTLLLVASPSFMSEKTGGQANYGEKEAIAKGLGSPMKSNMPGGYGSKTSGYGPTPKKKASVSPTTGAGRPEFISSNKGKKVSGNKSKVGGVGGARALGSSSSSGGSKAAKVGKAKAKVGRQTRYQRNELAMEQRKRSSSKPKKSIFSLFRKG